MGNRLTKIYTKKGDDGTTDLGGNQRVPKYDQQIEVYGCLDELSAAIGILVAEGDISENIQVFYAMLNRTYSILLENCRLQSLNPSMKRKLKKLKFS